jgi:hypothetical protein
MKRAFAMNVASMLPRNCVNSPVKSGATAHACRAKSPTTTRRSAGSRRDKEGVSMRRVWVARLGRNRYLFHRGAKCDRSETLGDRLGLVHLGTMVGAPECREHSRVVDERDGPLVVES